MSHPYPPALRFCILRKWRPLDIPFDPSLIRTGGCHVRVSLTRDGFKVYQPVLPRTPILQQIIGADEALARGKFANYAFVSALLVPRAARLLRGALKHERFLAENERRWIRLSGKVQKRRKHEDDLLHEYVRKLPWYGREEWAQCSEGQRLKKWSVLQRREASLHLKKLIICLQRALFESYYSDDCTVQSVSKADFRPPFWAWLGDEREEEKEKPLYETVKLRAQLKTQVPTNFPPASYLARLVSELGYDGRAAAAVLVSAHAPWTRVPDRWCGGVPFQSQRLLRPASPQLATDRHGEHKVTEAISRHRWDDSHSSAVYEIVYLGRKPFLVAASLGLRLETIYSYCGRVRRDLKGHP